MTFTVTYREKSGASAEVEIEAANRAECFAQGRAQGWAVIGVREGKSARSTPKKRLKDGYRDDGNAPRGGFPTRKLAWVMLAIVVIVGVGALWYWGGDRAQPSVQKEKKSSENPKAALAPENLPVKKTIEAPVSVATNNPVARPVELPLYDPHSAKSIAAYRRAVRASIAATNSVPPKPKRARPFKSSVDQTIAMLMSIPPGQPIPPVPLRPGAEEEFRKSLENPIEILETDSDEIVEMKKAVMQTREEMKQLMDKGYSIQQIIAEHRQLANESAKVRQRAIKEVREIVENGDDESARKYVATINAAFQQMGIPEITLPLSTAMRRQRAAERKSEREKKSSGATNGK